MKRLCLFVIFILYLSIVYVSAAELNPTNDYQALLDLNVEFSKFRRPQMIDGIQDYSRSAMKSKEEGLKIFRKRLADIDPKGWTISEKIDYLLMKSKLNELDFQLRVTRPWERDPSTYANMVARIPYVDTPLQKEALTRLARRLKTVGKILDLGKVNLKNVRLMPYTVEDVVAISAVELYRTLAFLRIEQHKNRNLPQLEPASTEEEHERRVREAETLTREFIKQHDLMTIPDYMPSEFETDAFWIAQLKRVLRIPAKEG